jgi:hypothetical protein
VEERRSLVPGLQGQTFAIVRAGAVSPLLRLIGATDKNSYVNVNADGLVARFGYYRVALPLTQIASAERAELPWYWGLGLRARGGTLALLGAHHGIVHITLNEPYRTTLLKIPLKVTHLYVSVDDPDGLVTALQPTA